MRLSNRDILAKYLRHNKKFPHIWCPGCGNGVVLGALLRAIDRAGFSKDEVVLVSGIGCVGRAPVYVDFNTIHTAHGRALPFATGVKAVNPALKVIALMGDGDAVGIGGNHFIHAARRNIGVAAIVVNNFIYAMTGGQESPTTPLGARSATSVRGAVEEPFDVMALSSGAGASFAARTTSYHVREMEDYIFQAVTGEGFSVVEVISACPTYYGRKNPPGEAVEMMKAQRDDSVTLDKTNAMSEEELGARVVRGVFAQKSREEWTAAYGKRHRGQP